MAKKRLKSSLNKMKKAVDKSVDSLDNLMGNPLKYISSGKSLKKSKSMKKSMKKSLKGGMHHKTKKHGGKKHEGGKYGSKKHHMGGVKKMKTKKKTKGKSKYNVFMKKEIHKLKNMPQFKGKKHSVVFKAAAKNWSKTNKKH